MKTITGNLLLCALLALACGSGEERGDAGGGGAVADSLRPETSPVASTVTLKGFYVFAHETNTFRPCGSDTFYWVTGNRRTVERLKMKYSQIAVNPLEEVYCEFRGWLSAEPHIVEGTSIVYEGQARVEELLSMRKRTDQDCLGSREAK